MNLTAREVLLLFTGMSLAVMLICIGNLIIDKVSYSLGQAIVYRSAFITLVGVAGLVGTLITSTYV